MENSSLSNNLPDSHILNTNSISNSTPIYYNLIDSKTKIKISTVFNNNSVDFGKQNMFDNNDDSSWYSDQGKFQYVFLFFDEPCEVSKIELTGSGELSYSVSNQFTSKKPEMLIHSSYFLEDNNDKQIMEVSIDKCQSLKLLIKSFYDLYGRVIIYDLKIIGSR